MILFLTTLEIYAERFAPAGPPEADALLVDGETESTVDEIEDGREEERTAAELDDGEISEND